MKSFVTMVVVLMMVASVGLAQSKVDFGINGILGIPVGETGGQYGIGFGGGLWVIIPTESQTVSFALGGGVESYPGKSTFERRTTYGGYMDIRTNYKDMTFVSFFVGPKFGEETGGYFLPAVSLNYQSELRVGLDIGGGILSQIGSGTTKVNIGVKFSIINLIGATGNESSQMGIRIVMGIVF